MGSNCRHYAKYHLSYRFSHLRERRLIVGNWRIVKLKNTFQAVSVTRPRLNSLLSQLHFYSRRRKEKTEWRVITYATTYLLKHHHWKKNQISLCSIVTTSHASTRRFRNTRARNYGTREPRPQSPCDFYAWKFLECSQLHHKMNEAASPFYFMLKVRHKSASS